MDDYQMARRSIEEAAQYVSSIAKQKLEIGIVLGSGLGSMADEIQNGVAIPYADIPGSPSSTAPGHKGELILGELGGRGCVAMRGRFHFYEGYSMNQVVFLVRVMATIGVRSLILTNAAGGVNRAMRPGDLMLITDHIGLDSDSPLRGPNFEMLGPRFNDQTHVYDPEYLRLARTVASGLNILLREGIYYYAKGPSYETPAEIRAIGILGGDAVGMSTVPEAVCANHAGMRGLGISCITNMAAGIVDGALNHDEVLSIGQAVSGKAALLVKTMIEQMD